MSSVSLVDSAATSLERQPAQQTNNDDFGIPSSCHLQEFFQVAFASTASISDAGWTKTGMYFDELITTWLHSVSTAHLKTTRIAMKRRLKFTLCLVLLCD